MGVGILIQIFVGMLIWKRYVHLLEMIISVKDHLHHGENNT